VYVWVIVVSNVGETPGIGHALLAGEVEER
jgi:hypothetical protein